MKKLLLSLISLIVVVQLIAQTEIKPLAVGAQLPMGDVELRDIDGAKSLNSLFGAKGLIVIFSSNTCPFVVGGKNFEGWEIRYNPLHSLAKRLGFNLVLINSNEAKRDNGESYADMQKRAKEMDYTMPYLYDANHLLADAMGAKTTPHVFFFNTEKKLVYTGSIDNNMEQKKKKSINYLEIAMNNVSKGKKVRKSSTPPIGCSVKRQSK
jgi:hypothetical protein